MWHRAHKGERLQVDRRDWGHPVDEAPILSLSSSVSSATRPMLAGSGQRMEVRALYRSQMWTVPLEDSDVLSVALQQQVTELTNKLATMEKERECSSHRWYV